MAYVINDSCVSCGTCEGECPVGAISAGDGKYEIAADTCIDCGTCAGVCPTGAIEQGYFPTYKKESCQSRILFYYVPESLAVPLNRQVRI